MLLTDLFKSCLDFLGRAQIDLEVVLGLLGGVRSDYCEIAQL